jgi:hypothetical protein
MFKLVLQSDGNVNLSNLIMIASHIGEVTSATYPSYDSNADGIVDIFDALLVAKKIL